MKTRKTFQSLGNALLFSATKALQLLVLAFAVALVLPSFAFADDTDLGQVEQINPNDRDTSQNPDMVNYYQDHKGASWHLWRRPDGTYYLKGKGFKAEISGAKVRTGMGKTYDIPDQTNNQRVDNFHNDVDSFVGREIALVPEDSPSSGASFFPLNLPTALAAEGDSSGVWQDTFTKTFGVVGFERVSDQMSLLGSSTADGNTPVVYTFDDTTQSWVLNVVGDGSELTFADGGVTHPGMDFTSGWVFGATPEPSNLILLGSGILGVSGLLRKRLLARS